MATLNKSTLNFAGAFTRLDCVVAKLARTKGIPLVCSITVEAPLFDGGPIMYRVDLSGGIGPVTLELDHQLFTAGDEYFAALAIPKLEAAITSCTSVTRVAGSVNSDLTPPDAV